MHDNGLGERRVMKRGEKVRVPNPWKPQPGRLDAPPAKTFRVKKKYRRRPKHPKGELDE